MRKTSDVVPITCKGFLKLLSKVFAGYSFFQQSSGKWPLWRLFTHLPGTHFPRNHDGRKSNLYSPENEGMSPENLWLESMYFLLKIVPFLGDIR